MTRPRLFLIDAHALCYRSFFAIKGLMTRSGQMTNAVYGFLNTLRKILREQNPEYLAVCFDVKGKTHRQEKFEDYKIQRPEMPDDLTSQIPIIKKLVEAYHLQILEYKGYEADDVIATVVSQMQGKGLEIIIVSDDKDMIQLVSEDVKIFRARNDEMMGPDNIEQAYGFPPSLMVDYIALAGDKVDNIPGVHGIGDVSAKKLLQQFPSIDRIFEQIDEVVPVRLQQRLRGQEDIARLSRELALLDSRVPCDIELSDLRVRPPDLRQLLDLFSQLEFRRLASEVAAELGGTTSSAKQPALHHAEPADVITHVRTREHCAFLFVVAGAQSELFAGDSCVLIAVDDEVWKFEPAQWKALLPLFEDAAIKKVTYGLKEQLRYLSAVTTSLRGDVFDVLLAGYLLDPTRAYPALADLMWQYCQQTPSGDNASVGSVVMLEPLKTVMARMLAEKNLDRLLMDIEVPLSHTLYAMEREGVAVDLPLLQQMSQECDTKIQALLRGLFEMAGEEFNVNSPKQLSHILFEKLKLPALKRTKTGYSTNESVLLRLAGQHPLPQAILEYRQLMKLKSTYIDVLPKLVEQKTGRIHAAFHQTGTETGRLSSSQPNLQNIPIRTELGRMIRRAFIPSKPENWLLSADYSQIELRILAHLSGDETLIRAFQQDEDIHRFTAALIFDVSEDDVTRDMRYAAKRVNFGIVYGMSAFGLSQDLKIPPPQAQTFIDKYFLRYPKVKVFMQTTIDQCRETGYVVTLLQRRRYIPEINSRQNGLRQFAERQAINTPVQGSAADLIKLAMIRIQREMEAQQVASRMIITVHDELVFDVVEREQNLMVDMIRRHMEGAWELTVPIKVSVQRGRNWLDLEAF